MCQHLLGAEPSEFHLGWFSIFRSPRRDVNHSPVPHCTPTRKQQPPVLELQTFGWQPGIQNSPPGWFYAAVQQLVGRFTGQTNSCRWPGVWMPDQGSEGLLYGGSPGRPPPHFRPGRLCQPDLEARLDQGGCQDPSSRDKGANAT